MIPGSRARYSSHPEWNDMQHYHDYKKISLKESLVTIGSIDGVQIGQQQIILALTAQAHKSGKPAVVVTFHPHPK